MKSDSYHKRRIGKRELQPATQMMSYGYDPFMSEGAVKPPVFLTSTFAFESAEAGADYFDLVAGRRKAKAGESGGLIYSRFNHPNLEIIEDRLALLDGGEKAVVTSSGMSAIATTFMALLRPGDVIVQSQPLYGGTVTLISGLLASWGVRRLGLPSPLTQANLQQALSDAQSHGRLAMVYLETPANPTNDMIDLAMVAETVAALGTADQKPVTVCDNTLLGPMYQQPNLLGIDLCVYSLTKYVGGHSDLVAGGISGRADLIQIVRQTRSAFGTQLDPHTSWMISRSMETLGLRMERAQLSAARIAAWLKSNPHLKCDVLHPEFDIPASSGEVFKRQCGGAGSTFSFVLEPKRELAFAVLNQLQLFKLAVSLGGSESLVCHPASTTHSGVPAADRDASGVSEGLVRLSIGLEDADDLIADLDQAFAAAKSA